MIPKPGDANREVPVNETFHEQADDELTEKELKQNVGNQNGLIVVLWNTNQNPNGNDIVVAARAEGNAIRNKGNQIRCYNYRGLGIQLQAEEFDLMATAVDLDESGKSMQTVF
nr:hypothetical protein [Tanacetum cinerariifolium]